MTEQDKIDPRIFDLYDEYCHGHIDRREFLSRATVMTIGGVSALWMAQALMPRYAEAQTISFTDPRMTGTYVDYPSPGGTSGTMRGYLVQPAGEGPFPTVLVIHENRGLNPHIEDVARRAAVAGFLALAPDGLSPVGGYPGNDDDGRELQRGLVPAELDQDMINSARLEMARQPVVWWPLLSAFLFMFVFVLSANGLADALRDVLDPHLNASREVRS